MAQIHLKPIRYPRTVATIKPVHSALSFNDDASMNTKSGFTLIELSIVLVIIGLIVGGILVGQDLIAAATVRAQITQIEKYNAAVNTFRIKYGGLPGDLPNPTASQFGFSPRGTNPGEGDGDGVIGQSNFGWGSVAPGYFLSIVGESDVFWVDLSTAKLIEGNFNLASETTDAYGSVSGTLLDSFLPKAKIGSGNYIDVWSGGPVNCSANNLRKNYFGVAAIADADADNSLNNSGTNTIRVIDAYNIDKKVDDGLPQSGRVISMGVGWICVPVLVLAGQVILTLPLVVPSSLAMVSDPHPAALHATIMEILRVLQNIIRLVRTTAQTKTVHCRFSFSKSKRRLPVNDLWNGFAFSSIFRWRMIGLPLSTAWSSLLTLNLCSF